LKGKACFSAPPRELLFWIPAFAGMTMRCYRFEGEMELRGATKKPPHFCGGFFVG
jgi:hypothetical protein